RLHQCAEPPISPAGIEANADHAVQIDRGNAGDAWPRHPYLGEVLEIGPGRPAGALRSLKLKLADDDSVTMAAEYCAVTLGTAVKDTAARACLDCREILPAEPLGPIGHQRGMR